MSTVVGLIAASAALSHVGTVRKVNEDACLELPDRGVWLVADGMGGHHAGDMASRMIVDAMTGLGTYGCLGELVGEVERRLLDVNGRIGALARAGGSQRVMGSTVAVLLSFRRQGACLWAGDSRVYRLRDGELKLLTRDHSEVEELIAQGRLLREDAEHHPSANVITRAVGAMSDESVDVKYQELRAGDRFLLCSDGLYRVLNESDIRAFLAQGAVVHACRRMLQEALARGCRDNVTAVVVEFQES